MVPEVDELNRTPRFTCDVSESDSTAGVSELENRLTVDGVTTILKVSLAVRPPRSVAETFTPSVPVAAGRATERSCRWVERQPGGEC